MQPPATLSRVYRKADIASALMSPDADDRMHTNECCTVLTPVPALIDLRLLTPTPTGTMPNTRSKHHG